MAAGGCVRIHCGGTAAPGQDAAGKLSSSVEQAALGLPAGRCTDLHLAANVHVSRLVLEGQAPLLIHLSALAGGHNAWIDQNDLILWAWRLLAVPLSVVHHQAHIHAHLGSCQPHSIVPAE